MSADERTTLAEAAAAALQQADIPGNRAAVKGAGLNPRELQLYWAVVQAFPDLGGPPDRTWIETRARALSLDAETALTEFAARDLIQRDPASGALTAAYPFSGIPTPHQVILAGRRPVSAMCAIDALGIPFMFDRDATVTSTDLTDGTPIRVTVTNGVVQWDPPEAVVLVGAASDAGVAAQTRCPFVNFFASAAAAESYMRAHPAVTGQVLSAAAALEAGKRVFGSPDVLAASQSGGDGGDEPCCQ